MKISPNLRLLLLSLGLFMSAQAKDGRWIDPVDPSIPVDFKYQGEYLGTLENGSKMGCQVVSLGAGVFQAALYPGGLPGAGWDGKNRSIMDGKLNGDEVIFTAASGKRAHLAATRGREKNPSSTRVSLVTIFPPVGHKPCAAQIQGEEMKGEFEGNAFRLSKTIRKSPTLGSKPPEGALVLFDGSSKEEWSRGSINEKFATLMPKGDLVTKRQFNNYSIHLEFMLPYQPDYRSQDRGNSGFYQVHDYEIQILDSFAMDGAHNECGGIYSHRGSDVNMCLPPLVWQTFDVEFTNAVAKNRKKTKNAIITVRHNGVLIHDKFEIPGKSKYGARGSPEGTPGPIKLQDHREPLQFRNIWIVPNGPIPLPPTSKVAETKPKPAPKPTPPASDAAKAMLGEWYVRFANNDNAYVLNLKKDGRSHLARAGKAWDGVWIVENDSLTITNPHDVIRISLAPKSEVYSGKNKWGATRLSRKELSRF